jgi:hypothetical protein
LRDEDPAVRPSGGRVGGAYPNGGRTEGARPSKKRTRDDRGDDDSEDDDSVHTHPRKRAREEEWGLLKYCGLFFCCIDFLLSFRPEALEANERVRNQQIAKDEIKRILETQEQLKKHPEYYIVRGQKVYLADVGYSVRFPHQGGPPLEQDGESTTTPSSADDHGTQTRPPGTGGSGLYRPGVPPPPDDRNGDTYRPHKGAGGASKFYVTPTPTTPGEHIVALPGSIPHVTGPPIRQRPVDEGGYESRIPRKDNRGRLIDKHGRLVDKKGRLLDEKGRLVDEHGRIPYHLLDDDDSPWAENYKRSSGTRQARSPGAPPQPSNRRPVRLAKHPPQPSVEDETEENSYIHAGRPPGMRPAIPEAGETSEASSAHETLPNRTQQHPSCGTPEATKTQLQPPTDESSPLPGDTQPNGNGIPLIASSLPGHSRKKGTGPALIGSTVYSTRFLDNTSVPATGFKRPGRIPAAFQSDEDAEMEKKMDPVGKLHAQDSQYRPLRREYKIIGTPRGAYAVRRAPDMVIDEPTVLDIDELLGKKTLLDRTTFDEPKKCGVDNPNCQQYEAATFTDGRSLRAHELTHDFMMFGGVGPAGSCDEEGNAYPLSPEEKEKLLRERQESRRSVIVEGEYERVLWENAHEVRDRMEREKAEEPLTDDDLQQQMTAERFERKLEEETIGDEVDVQQVKLSQQQQQESYEQQELRLFKQQQHELYAQQLDEFDQQRQHKEFFTIYNDDELEAMIEEDELREWGLL